MFCQNCGKEINDQAVICVGCGNQVKPVIQSSAAAPSPVLDVPSGGLNVLSFFFPLIGLILYLVWLEKTPIKAKKIGKWALIGVILNVVIIGFMSAIGG